MAAFRRVQRVLANFVVAWALLAAPSAASAATAQADMPCYLENRSVLLSGAGFTPGAAFNVTRDGRSVGDGTVAADGTVSKLLSSGDLDPGIAKKAFDLTISDGTNQAETKIFVSRFGVDFAPTRGDAASLRVRFSVFGFLRTGVPIYVHYLQPGGRSVRTVRLGLTKGQCGEIARTKLRRLFPFRPRSGRWQLQFDTQKIRRRTAVPRVVRTINVRSR